MNRFLNFIDRISFRRIFSMMFLVTGILVVPFLWWANSQRYTYKSKAALEPTAIPTPVIYGSVPDEHPVITGVFPFYGKPGDEVLIQGTDFGDNPPNSSLTFGGLPARVISWSNEEIRFALPEGTASGQIALQTGVWSAGWDKPLTVYTETTPIQAIFENGVLSLSGSKEIDKVLVWHDGQAEPDVWQPADRYEKIDWLVIYGQTNEIVPFWIDPLKFN